MAYKDKTRERIHQTWADMRQRCHNPRHPSYPRYGGRGIGVCKEWDTSFLNFYRWALQNGYADHLTIDRINNDGNYEPQNCRWATRLQQSLNRSTTRYVARQDMELYIALRWQLQGLKQATIKERLKSGWSVRMALTTPARPYKRRTTNQTNQTNQTTNQTNHHQPSTNL